MPAELCGLARGERLRYGAPMKFPTPLIRGRLIKRYKRFLADVCLEDGTIVTAHCANPGAMTGLHQPGSEVWLSRANNPKRKLQYSWEMVVAGDGSASAQGGEASGGNLVGINTAHPNRLAIEAIENGTITELAGYAQLTREKKYGANSRIDILLQDEGRPDCYVEVKNVHLMRTAGVAEFPDSVTKRGAKHLEELAAVAASGARAVMLYLIQRSDAKAFALAADIDPAYVAAFEAARQAGVEAIAYGCSLTPEEIRVTERVPFQA